MIIKQVTLSENVHKFAELSQRIVVEKSVIQKYEEELTLSNTIKSTTEISVDCSRMMSSSLSSSGMIAFSSSTDRISEIRLPEEGDHENNQTDDGPSGETNGISNGENKQSEHQTCAEHNAEHIDAGEMIKAKTSSKMKLSKIATNVSGSESTKTLVNTPDSIKACDLLSQFASTPTSKLPPHEVTVQRPLKPQSEMDFSVPYNIINNYFSVGVVSAIYSLFFFSIRKFARCTSSFVFFPIALSTYVYSYI